MGKLSLILQATRGGKYDFQHMEREIYDIEMEVIRYERYTNALALVHYKPIDNTVTLPSFLPGQFVQIWVKPCNGVMLRRPISIFDGDSNHLSLLIQDAGKGTHSLLNAPIGSRFRMLLPLGNPFTLPTSEARPLLIGGGVGVAPLYALGKDLKAKGYTPTFLLGARSHSLFPNLELFRDLGTVHITTEDHSLGEQGYVTDHSCLTNHQYTHIFTCGPTPMMRAVSRWAKAEGIPTQASLENHMACGIGVCLCCVEPTVKGHKTVCHDGPVFDTEQLLWD